MLRSLYVDFNSYFASVEQHLRPELRGKPIAVLPVMAETTCCIAASYEAKAFGIKTGTIVREARKMCPEIILVEARPHAYINYHHKLIALVESCTHVEKVYSIDEMACRLTGTQQQREIALQLANKIKSTIRREISDQIKCSIGIAPNTFLSKLATDMQKPDGCVVIEQHDIPNKLIHLNLRDLCGIGRRMEERLNLAGIDSITKLYAMNAQQLKSAWGSIEGERFYSILRGIEIISTENPRNSIGHSHVLPPDLRTHQGAYAVLHRLVQKVATRLRNIEMHANSMQIKVKFLDKPSWKIGSNLSSTSDTIIFTHALDQFWKEYPSRKSSPFAVGVTLHNLHIPKSQTHDLFNQASRRDNKLDQTIDLLNNRFGRHTVYFGSAHTALHSAPTRIAFNRIPDSELEN